jgi:hypothetical protein
MSIAYTTQPETEEYFPTLSKEEARLPTDRERTFQSVFGRAKEAEEECTRSTHRF